MRCPSADVREALLIQESEKNQGERQKLLKQQGIRGKEAGGTGELPRGRNLGREEKGAQDSTFRNPTISGPGGAGYACRENEDGKVKTIRKVLSQKAAF